MKALDFCKLAVRKKTTPKYVRLQMKDFIKIAEGRDKKYKVSEKKLKQLEGILWLLIMPKGLKAGETVYESAVGYQWLFWTATLCVVHRDDETRRRYQTGLLEICRKNFKTFTIAVILIYLILTEPPFSQFFSVAPDGALSREIKNAMAELIRSSPFIYEHRDTKRFKLLRDYIKFIPNNSIYTPLAYSTSRLDGRRPSAFCADEVGALPNSYSIEAMRSGQVDVQNKLSFIISTKYPSISNPLEDETSYAKRVLDGIEKDETYFALLYEPDETFGWETNDLILQQSNPAALEIPEIWLDLLQKRALAIAVESKRENFVTKHCNIVFQGASALTYLDVKDVQACRAAKIEWSGRIVYVGVDLSKTSDNTAVSIVAVDDDSNILFDSWAFIPEGRIEEKTVTEKVNYRELMRTGHVIACGDRTIDYKAVEDFVLGLESKLGVRIQAIGIDPWNGLSSAQKWEAAGYNVVEVQQHSRVLHPPTKLFKEKVLNGEVKYERNTLFELNVQNARCKPDTNLNEYVTKQRSAGKVDMLMATLDAVYLVQQDYFLNQMDFAIQII